MTTIDNERDRLLRAATAIQAKKHAREAGVRAFACSHLGLPAGTVCEQVEAILRPHKAKDLSDAQLMLVLHYAAGIPPGFQLSEDQIDIAVEALLANRA
jgi:hypothetical protein